MLGKALAQEQLGNIQGCMKVRTIPGQKEKSYLDQTLKKNKNTSGPSRFH